MILSYFDIQTSVSVKFLHKCLLLRILHKCLLLRILHTETWFDILFISANIMKCNCYFYISLLNSEKLLLISNIHMNFNYFFTKEKYKGLDCLDVDRWHVSFHESELTQAIYQSQTWNSPHAMTCPRRSISHKHVKGNQ